MQKKIQCTWTLVNARIQPQRFVFNRRQRCCILITNSGFKTFKSDFQSWLHTGITWKRLGFLFVFPFYNAESYP